MKLPVAYGLVLGGDEIYGTLDENGNFQEQDPLTAEKKKVVRISKEMGLELPCTAEIVNDAGEPVAILNMGVAKGRVACISAEAIPGGELTGHIFRRVPVSKLVSAAVKGKIVYFRPGFAVHFVQGPFGHILDGLEKPRRRSLNDDFLLQVAHIYREALSAKEFPGQAIQRHLGPTSEANARHWVQLAREAGFLGRALGPGQIGEAQSS